MSSINQETKTPKSNKELMIAWESADTDEKKQELEHLWTNSPIYAYLYARDVIKGPWEPGEKAIANDEYYAALYAINVYMPLMLLKAHGNLVKR